jgi:hypothetical protein
MALPGVFAARRKETIVTMVTQAPFISQLYQAPKPQVRELTIEQKAARYDQFVGIKEAKHATRRQINSLNRQLERLDLEENKVLRVGYEVEPCGLCGLAHEGIC